MSTLQNVPAELKRLCRWVMWRTVTIGDRPTKVPFRPDGAAASTTDRRTWSRFDEVLAQVERGRFDGAGFVLGGGFCGVDLDKCITSEGLEPWAREIVDQLNSYTELSPSRRGLHILLYGTLPPNGNKRGRVEMYDRDRYFTITGWQLVGTPRSIEHRQDELTALHRRIFPKSAEPQQLREPANLTLTDAELLSKIRASKQGDKFTRLFDDGDWTGYASQSEADMALCGILGWWTGGDVGRVDRLFRTSALCREKWLKRPAYRHATLARAAGG